jgi:hypothetical protein
MKTLVLLGLCIAMRPTAASAQNVPGSISLVIVEGEGATSYVRQRVTHDPVVRLEDDDHRPIAGAPVVFALPVSGTSGEFLNGSRNLTVITDSEGLAAARGLRTNDSPGKLQIYVTASYRGLRARTLVNQVVQPAPGGKPVSQIHSSGSHGKWKWIVLGIAAGGGAGAGVYFAHQSSNSSSPVSISTGAVSFGSPR